MQPWCHLAGDGGLSGHDPARPDDQCVEQKMNYSLFNQSVLQP